MDGKNGSTYELDRCYTYPAGKVSRFTGEKCSQPSIKLTLVINLHMFGEAATGGAICVDIQLCCTPATLGSGIINGANSKA